ncbi:MAG: ribose transport system ATP-binding protein [Planctomycetota bacterium]|jgi:ribose transport system ATP-binding protein
MHKPLLSVRGVHKRYPGVVALDQVDLTLNAGEILGVVGENGAGKSTLMKILAGIERPDAGSIELEGRTVIIGSTRVASSLGIALIHQELSLAPNLSVGANVFLGREPARFGLVDHAAIRARTETALQRIGADFSADASVESLAIGQQQGVEIAKALAQDAKILILDEPTSSLSLAESRHLVAVIQSLREKGVSIIYISHRLSEVSALCDRVLVLRDGMNSGELSASEISHGAMVRLMVGRDVSVEPSLGHAVGGEPVLRITGLRTAANPHHAVSLAVSKGEIVGLSGLVGAGRTELMRTLFGVDRQLEGQISISGTMLPGGNPQQSIRAGIGFVPEDRKQHGLFLDLALQANIGIASLAQNSRHGFVDMRAEAELAVEMIKALSIKASGPDQTAGLLSGGNQQKVVLAKWLATRPKLLLLDEPTRGIDVGSRQEIYAILRRLAKDGVSILFASSEMEEVLALSDRTLVMHRGRLAGELSRSELSEEAVMHLAVGGVRSTSAGEDRNDPGRTGVEGVAR